MYPIQSSRRLFLGVVLMLLPLVAAAQQPPTPAPTGTATSLEEAGTKWAAFVEAQFVPQGFSGGIHLSKVREVIHEQFWGGPVRGSEAAFDRDTRFNLASMGKMFTAVAIGQLVDAGKVAWSDPVGKHWPDFPWDAYRDVITIEQLLAHRSGLGGYDFGHGKTDVEDIVMSAAGDPLAFEPDAEFGYSNLGYAVLGVVIERVTGQSYYDYIRTEVFRKAGMSRSGFFDARKPVDNMALGYTRMGEDGRPTQGEPRPNVDIIERIGSPGGGAYATLRDLQSFALALQEDRLVSREVRDELWRGRSLMGGVTYYALGFGNRTSGGMQVVGHNGGAPGIGAVLQLFPETGVVAVAFTNGDPMPINPLTREIVGLVTSIPR